MGQSASPPGSAAVFWPGPVPPGSRRPGAAGPGRPRARCSNSGRDWPGAATAAIIRRSGSWAEKGRGASSTSRAMALPWPDEILVKPGGLAAGEDDGQHVQGVEIRVVQAHDMKPGEQGLHLGDLLHDGPALAPLGRLGEFGLGGHGRGGNLRRSTGPPGPGPARAPRPRR